MDHDKVVSQNRAALRATIDFAEKQLGVPAWEPAAGSEAIAELSNTETRNDGSPWGERPPRTAYAAANLMMRGVIDHLKSLERLLADSMPVIGPTVIARSAIEMASGAWWLMEPGIGVRRRVCRELVASLASARWAMKGANDYEEKFRTSGDPMPKEITKLIADVRQREAMVLQRSTNLAVTAPTPGTNTRIETEQADAATTATASMLEALLPPDMPGTIFYRTYSAVTHGQLYGLMNFTTLAVQPDGTPFLQWRLPPDLLDSTIQIAIGAVRQPYLRIATVMGWDQNDANLWDAELHAIYNS